MLTNLDRPLLVKAVPYLSASTCVTKQAQDRAHITKSNIKLAALLVAVIGFSVSSITFAEQSNAIAISAGVFEISDDNEAAEIGIEYRFAPLKSAYNLIPTLGFSANEDEAYWLYGGVRYDVNFSENWVLTPNFAVSYYDEGDSTDLGHDIEFRTGLELAYKINAGSHLGVAVYHLSNAGLDDINPGSDSVILSYSFSL